MSLVFKCLDSRLLLLLAHLMTPLYIIEMLTEMTAFYWFHALAHALTPLVDVIGSCAQGCPFF